MPEYFEFEVSLRDVTPKIWRRFLIAKMATPPTSGTFQWSLRLYTQRTCAQTLAGPTWHLARDVRALKRGLSS